MGGTRQLQPPPVRHVHHAIVQLSLEAKDANLGSPGVPRVRFAFLEGICIEARFPGPLPPMSLQASRGNALVCR